MPQLRVIVLAAQRKGITDPLATRFGVGLKCLVPLAGRALISHVVESVATHPNVASVAISVELEAFADIANALNGLQSNGDLIHNVPARDNLADSVIAAARGHDGPIIITTADNVLLTHASIDAIADALRLHDVAIAMAPREAVLAAHAEGQRRFYRFRGGEYSNCNLYGLAGANALGAAEFFRGGGQFAKKASRIAGAFGLANLILLRLRVISLQEGLRRISRRIGLDIAPVILRDGSQAIDVDNDRTYAVVSALLGERAGARSAACPDPAGCDPLTGLAPARSGSAA